VWRRGCFPYSLLCTEATDLHERSPTVDEQFGTNDPVETPENERGQVADAVEGRREAEEDIAAAEQAADADLARPVDDAVDQDDSFRS
jgi:hypothetical protein